MNHQIAIIGLGYVGLPLARLFATKYPVVGFDINQHRISELRAGTDTTLEVSDELLQSVLLTENPFTDPAPDTSHPASSTVHVETPADPTDPHGSSADPASRTPHPAPHTPHLAPCTLHPAPGLYCSADLADIKKANIYIITVPTPVDKNNRPDLTPLYKASETVGQVLKKGDIVIYESTVYPGATEEECIPVLEKISGLKFNQDFFAGYSPERINPGDKEHTVEKILKVTAGSTPDIGKVVDDLYKSVITAGTHLAPTIKVAEAAKVIENSQRDINIAFVNELAKIFNLMDIDTHAVLEAAGTKWNFLPFKPGLVGGHCIGVDPYYLAQKAQEYGYHPEIILAGRRLNDSMGSYIASQVVKAMIRKDISINGSRVLMLGITFKENCPDVRNTKIVDVIAALEDYGVQVDIYDPWANAEEVKQEYGLTLASALPSTLPSALPSTSTRQFECFPEAERKEKVSRTECPPTADVSGTECPPTVDVSGTECPPQAEKDSPTLALSVVEGSDSSLPTPDSQLPTQYDAIILGVAHKEFLSLNLNDLQKERAVVYDVKGILEKADNRL